MEKHRITQTQRFLIRYKDDDYEFVSVADDDAFPANSFVPNPLPPTGQLGIVIGSSLGLFCLFGPRDIEHKMTAAVIWNPTIKKTVTISLPDVEFPFDYIFGFGVCPTTGDAKIIKIEDISKQIVGKPTLFPWDVEVYTLSTRVWRRPLSMLPRTYMAFDYPRFQVVVDGVIYWYGDVSSSDLDASTHAIISFNLTNEVFRAIPVPSCLAHQHFSINKLRESLVLLHCDMEFEPNVLNVWMMDHGGSDSFTKISTIHMPYESIWETRGLRKNDQLILWKLPKMKMVDSPHLKFMIPQRMPGSILGFMDSVTCTS